MSRSCHKATSCSPASRLDREDPRQPADRLGRDRVALVRHRRRALLARLEPLLHLAHLGALQVAQLDGDQLARRRRPRRTPRGLGVTIAGDHLRRRHRASARGARRRTLRPRGRRWSTCRPRRDSLHTATDRRAAVEAGRGRGRPAAPTARPWRRTSSARRGCRGCARSSPCRGGCGRGRPACDSSSVDASISRVGGIAQRPAQRGVDDVATRSARSGSTTRPARRSRACTTSTNAATSWSVDRLALEHGGDERVVDDGGALRGRPRRRRPARRRARRGPRWPAARPRASGRSVACRPRPPAISGVRVPGDHRLSRLPDAR